MQAVSEVSINTHTHTHTTNVEFNNFFRELGVNDCAMSKAAEVIHAVSDDDAADDVPDAIDAADDDANDALPAMHSDPFVLSTDRCTCPTCEYHNAKPARLYPCVGCFGKHLYCGDDCMDDDYPDHTLECSKAKRKVIRSTVPLINRRRKQMTSSGFTNLLRFVIQNTSRDLLLNNLFWIRLPWDPTVRLTREHTVKKVGRTEIAHLVKSTIVLKETYKVWLRHVENHPHPHIYFFTYPSDMSFVFMTAMRYDEEEIVDPEAAPMIELVTCPCVMHKPRAAEDKQQAAELASANADADDDGDDE